MSCSQFALSWRIKDPQTIFLKQIENTSHIMWVQISEIWILQNIKMHLVMDIIFFYP